MPAGVLDPARIEPEIRRVGAQIADAFPSPARHPVRAADRRAMEISASDRELRAALFRLVEVSPACRSLDDLARHLVSYTERVEHPPQPLAAAMRAADTRAGRLALGMAAAAGVRHMAHRFIIGSRLQEALRTLRALWERGIASSVDLLGEATLTAAEADSYAAACARAITTLSRATRDWPPRPVLEADGLGALPRANVSLKVSALTPLLRPDAPRRGLADAKRRLAPLLALAAREGAHAHVDMESLDTREAVLALTLEMLSEPELREGPSLGIVIQAYLRDSPAQLETVLAHAAAAQRAFPLTVRLVKGAYWDHELVQARQRGWPAPVFATRAQCDRNFEALTRRLLEAQPPVRVAVASHNLRSIAHAIAANRALGRADSELELQVLRGLGDELAEALAQLGLRVRCYCPVGELVAGMAYLVRRLLENTSNESFLSAQASGASLQQLLAAP